MVYAHTCLSPRTKSNKPNKNIPQLFQQHFYRICQKLSQTIAFSDGWSWSVSPRPWGPTLNGSCCNKCQGTELDTWAAQSRHFHAAAIQEIPFNTLPRCINCWPFTNQVITCMHACIAIAWMIDSIGMWQNDFIIIYCSPQFAEFIVDCDKSCVFLMPFLCHLTGHVRFASYH